MNIYIEYLLIYHLWVGYARVLFLNSSATIYPHACFSFDNALINPHLHEFDEDGWFAAAYLND
jgi:hypothetical protein